MTGSTSQSVNMAAGTYSISLDAAQRAIGPSNQTIEVLVDNALVGTNYAQQHQLFALYDRDVLRDGRRAYHRILGLEPARRRQHGLDRPDGRSWLCRRTSRPIRASRRRRLGAGPAAYTVRSDGLALDVQRICGPDRQRKWLHGQQSQRARNGSQVAFLQITGSVSQSFVIAPGVYDVSLLAAQRGIGPSNQNGSSFVDGQLVSSINPTGTATLPYTSGSL